MNFDPYLILWQITEIFNKSPYIKIGIVVGCAFLLILVLGSTRKHFFHLSMKGALFGFILGLMLMIVLDLVIILGISDKAGLANLLSADRKKEDIQNVFISGVNNLSNVLGVSVVKNKKTPQEIYLDSKILTPDETIELKNLLCPQ